MRSIWCCIVALLMSVLPTKAQDYPDPQNRIFAPLLISGNQNAACRRMRDALEVSYYSETGRVSPLPPNAQLLTPEPLELTLMDDDGVTRSDYRFFYTLDTGSRTIVLHHWQPWLAGSPTYQYGIVDQSVEELVALAATHRTSDEFRKHVSSPYYLGAGEFYDEFGDGIFFELDGEIYVYPKPHNSGVERSDLIITLVSSDPEKGYCELQAYSNDLHGSNVALPELPPLTMALFEKVMVPYGAPFGYSCGRSASRLDSHLRGKVLNLLEQIEERPWVFRGNPSALDNLSDWARENHSLQQYAYTGIWEWRAFTAIRDFSYQPTMQELTLYIANRHGFDLADAEAMAAEAIVALVRLTPPFPGTRDNYYGPADYRLLRERFAAGESLQLYEIDFLLRMMAFDPQDGDNFEQTIAQFQRVYESVEQSPYYPNYSVDRLLYEGAINKQAVSALLGAGASIDAANGFGKTALMHAAHHNAFASVELLLKRGADVRLKTNEGRDDAGLCGILSASGRTALSYGLENADARLIQLLINTDGSADGQDEAYLLERLDFNNRLTPAEKADIRRQLQGQTQ